ncbi:hypothetical protein DPEC_G00006280 [Dallia pectoralis]|uniref:Uncharacterized protein n=1 Tax=Dallia pectoralis TaxID=75939 RepID=A0ACC2HK17_DALPE|nr:hypothetical protein DPEC_G00006280 [Dallia pectoralis]
MCCYIRVERSLDAPEHTKPPRGSSRHRQQTAMAPCSTDFSLQHRRFADKDIKIRKPIVEKMRRDRINNCIEQLKLILEKEFHKHDPNTKLEKADILEMTVSFLRQRLQMASSQRDFNESNSQCWTESLQFQSESPKRDSTSFRPFQGLSSQVQRSSSSPTVPSTCPASSPTILQDTRANGSVWRPW